jgi:hypothetical protein
VRTRWLTALLLLPSTGMAAVSAVCNATGFYLGATHVVLTVLSSVAGDGQADRSVIPTQCGNHSQEGNVIHRAFPDLVGKPAFGYNLAIVPDPAGRRFRITVEKPAGGLRTFMKLPAPVSIADGDRVDIPVLENPKTGVRVLDSYAIAYRGTGVATLPMPRDFPGYLPAATLLHLEEPRLRSETSDLGDNPQFGVSGPVVWIYSRWLGRVLFSATPRAGYRRLAVAEGASIRFTDGVEHYRLDMHASALAAPGTWWLWVKREPDFQPPAGPWTIAGLHRGTLALGAER